MKRRQIYQIFIRIFLICVVFMVYSHPALAIGPGTGGSKIRVDDEHLGPYILLVATAPLPVTVGQMSVWVRVTGIEDNKLRRDASVMVEAKLRGGDATAAAQGTHKNAGNDFDYVAHLDVEQAGQWDVTVTVADELGEAEVVFTETVTRGRSVGLLIGLAIPFVVVAVIVGIYLWRRSGGKVDSSV